MLSIRRGSAPGDLSEGLLACALVAFGVRSGFGALRRRLYRLLDAVVQVEHVLDWFYLWLRAPYWQADQNQGVFTVADLASNVASSTGLLFRRTRPG